MAMRLTRLRGNTKAAERGAAGAEAQAELQACSRNLERRAAAAEAEASELRRRCEHLHVRAAAAEAAQQACMQLLGMQRRGGARTWKLPLAHI